MSMEGRTVLQNGMKEVDGSDEKHWRGKSAPDAQVVSDEESFSSKECHDVSYADEGHVHVGWSCPHLQLLNHWHQSGRWERRRGRGTKRG